MLERLIIALFAVFALFPLYQSYAETDAREPDRLANLVVATDACQVTGAFPGQSLDTLAAYTMALAVALLNEDPKRHAASSLRVNCTSIADRLIADPTLLGSKDRAEEI